MLHNPQAQLQSALSDAFKRDSVDVQAAPASRSVQQIREARLQPLKVALQDAIALHTKATGVREALEAEVRNMAADGHFLELLDSPKLCCG